MADSGRYRGTDGRVVTSEQIEQEFRKARIVAGKPTSGPEYADGLRKWRTTYTPITAEEQRATVRPVKVFFWAMCVVAVIAFIALAGGGFLAFFVVLIVGGFLSMGLAAIVTFFSMPAAKDSKPSSDASALSPGRFR